MSDVFNVMNSPIKTEKETEKPIKAITVKTVLQNNKPDFVSDAVNLTETTKEAPIEIMQEKLTDTVKKGVYNGVICGAITYCACDIVNALKEKALKNTDLKAKSTLSAKFPSKFLAIAAGVVSTAASLWTIYTTEKFSDFISKHSPFKNFR